MTNKEAIKIITIVKGLITNDNSYSDEAKPAIKEAFNLAIKALEDRIQEDNYNLGFGSDRVCIEHLNDKDREHLLNKIRPQGEWIKHFDNLFPEESTEECSICHEEQFLNRGNDDNFCPNCGADMRGGAE